MHAGAARRWAWRIGAVALVVASWPRGAAAEPCRSIARIGGEAELALPIAVLLRERAVPLDGDGACGQVIAQVAPVEGRQGWVRITLRDDAGRTIEREAEDVEAAATTIESWVRRDLAEPLLASRVAPTEPEPYRVTTARDGVGSPAATPPAFALAAFALVGVSGDRATWLGVRADGCARVGRLCLGGSARYVRDRGTTGALTATTAARSALDLLVQAELPLARGRFELAPALGLGQTTITTARVGGEAETHASALLVAGATGRVRLGAWSLVAALELGVSPGAQRQIVDLDTGPDRDPTFAGSPRTRTWLGLGLAYGAP